MKDVNIIVLDFGSQYTQLIARRLREDKVYCEVLPYHTKVDAIKAKNPKGIILSGGPSSVYNKDAYEVDQGVYALGIPVLGICYGMQRIAVDFGGSVIRSDHHEYGKAELTIDMTQHSVLFEGCEDERAVWMSHSDKVDVLPEGFVPIAYSPNSPYAAIADESRHVYAMQYHPEVNHSEEGYLMLRNFARKICGITEKWDMGHFLKEQIIKIRAQVGEGKVLCALSGGVDSSVVAALLYEAIGNQLIPVFVDNGLLRKGERESVENIFKVHLKVPLVVADASENFLGKLAGVTDPETKRKIIGHTFIEVFEAEAKKHDGIKFLAQGTLYPDVIESVSVNGPSVTIKSHHNVGGLPDWMDFELIEPLRDLFKDEVRKLGIELGLPESLVNRHPFPGPGLGIRIMGEVNKADLNLLREADAILLDELKASGYYMKTWQAFAVLLNVKSVGVMGDNRTYDNTVCVRVVEAVDGMTATFAHLPHTLLERISRRIINEVDGINRVVYDISSKPPQRSSGNKALHLRPIYLISKTPHSGVIHIPILKTRFFTPDIDFSQYDGLIVTSKQILKALEGYSDQWRTLPIIAVSESTAEVFQKEGCAIAAVADGYGEGVGLIVEKQFSQMRWLYLRPERVASLWAEAAREKGVKIDEAVMYKTECNDESSACEIAENGILIFTSPSSIRCFCEKRAILPTHTVVVIGKTTKNALPDGIDATLSPSVSVASAVDLGRQIASKRSNSSPF